MFTLDFFVTSTTDDGIIQNSKANQICAGANTTKAVMQTNKISYVGQGTFIATAGCWINYYRWIWDWPKYFWWGKAQAQMSWPTWNPIQIEHLQAQIFRNWTGTLAWKFSFHLRSDPSLDVTSYKSGQAWAGFIASVARSSSTLTLHMDTIFMQWCSIRKRIGLVFAGILGVLHLNYRELSLKNKG